MSQKFGVLCPKGSPPLGGGSPRKYTLYTIHWIEHNFGTTIKWCLSTLNSAMIEKSPMQYSFYIIGTEQLIFSNPRGLTWPIEMFYRRSYLYITWIKKNVALKKCFIKCRNSLTLFGLGGGSN